MEVCLFMISCAWPVSCLHWIMYVCVRVCVGVRGYVCVCVCSKTHTHTQSNWHPFSGVICPRGPRHGSVSSPPSLSAPTLPPPSLSPPPSVFLCFCLSWQSTERCDLLPRKRQRFQGFGEGEIRLPLQRASRLLAWKPPPETNLAHMYKQNMLTCLSKHIHTHTHSHTHTHTHSSLPIHIYIIRSLNKRTRRWVYTPPHSARKSAHITHLLRREHSHMRACSHTRLSVINTPI